MKVLRVAAIVGAMASLVYAQVPPNTPEPSPTNVVAVPSKTPPPPVAEAATANANTNAAVTLPCRANGAVITPNEVQFTCDDKPSALKGAGNQIDITLPPNSSFLFDATNDNNIVDDMIVRAQTSTPPRPMITNASIPNAALTALVALKTLTLNNVEFQGRDTKLRLALPKSVTTLRIQNSNLIDLSLDIDNDVTDLKTVDLTDNKFEKLPKLFYERRYNEVLKIEGKLTLFNAASTELEALEFENARANMGAMNPFVEFKETCTTSTDGATAKPSVCVAGMPKASGSKSDTTESTRAPSKSSNSSLTIIVIVVAIIAAALAYFVARRFLCVSSRRDRRRRARREGREGQAQGLISKDDAIAGKMSFISSDDALRDIRLEQQDVVLNKSVGTGRLWVGEYDNKKVIIKRVEAENSDSYVTKGLISQARSLAPLAHDNIVKVIGVTWIQGTDFGIVGEYMDKGSLKSLLMDMETELDLHAKVDMCLQIAQGLAYLHDSERNLYMKRLSSRKVLINSSLECKLNLFDCHPITNKLEIPEVFGAGDMPWWAPELVTRSSPFDARKINMFALGVLMSEILTRVSPYQAEVDAVGHTLADLELVKRIRRQERLAPHENRREFVDAPPMVREIIEQCLSYQPHARPTAAEVVSCLETVKHLSLHGTTTSL